MVGFGQCFTTRSEATSVETLVKPNHRMCYLQRFTMAYSSIYSFCYEKIFMLQTKTSILYINTNHTLFISPLILMWTHPRSYNTTRATWQQIRLIDNLDSGRMRNASDSPRLLTNKKAGVGGVASESGRIFNLHA